MGIIFREKEMQFQLNTKNSSYVMAVENDYLCHVYWGAALEDEDHTRILYRWGRCPQSAVVDYETGVSLDSKMLEFSGWGRSDLRTPSLCVVNSDGSNIVDLKFAGFTIIEGKPKLDGLPSTFAAEGDKTQTLKVILKDSVSGVLVELYYAVFERYDVITRWIKVCNHGMEPVQISNVMSGCIDFDHMKFDVISNYGTWGRERHLERFPVRHGRFEIFSRRGASSHIHNPAFALVSPDTTEKSGNAYGFLLVYSGSYTATIEAGQYDTTRVLLGLDRDGFEWLLYPEEEFTSPEIILSYSQTGLGGMSRNYHRMLRENLIRSPYRGHRTPIVVNTWEACNFNISQPVLLDFGKKAASLGAELLVMDDGWFGQRNGEASSLGDWQVNLSKLPDGVTGLADGLQKVGCKLGIWFEPEMVSEDSDLYRQHPDWCLRIEGRPLSPARFQYMLDLTRREVCDFIYDTVAGILQTGVVQYVKWDFNRNLAEVGSKHLGKYRQGEVPHRYILGLYDILERLVTAFPAVLFESCASGGGRYDAGMLYYMPQTWTSDNSDAIARLKIQYGTSLFYPLSSMVGHVSDIPNKQTGHVTPFHTRLAVALTGSFGYELDPCKLTAADQEAFQKGVSLYKTYGDMIVNGDYYRLRSPFEENCSAWCVVSEDGSVCLAVYVRMMAEVNGFEDYLTLQGLDAQAWYVDENSGDRISGSHLMGHGLKIPWNFGEYDSIMWILKRQ